MKTIVTMTPEELENIKKDIFKDIILSICTGTFKIDVEDIFWDNKYSISARAYYETQEIRYNKNLDYHERVDVDKELEMPPIEISKKDMNGLFKNLIGSKSSGTFLIKEFTEES